MTESAGLACVSTTAAVSVDVEFADHVENFERLVDDEAKNGTNKILFEFFAVHNNFAFAGTKSYAGVGGFSSTGRIVKLSCHIFFSFLFSYYSRALGAGSFQTTGF